jgi:predicted RNA binding protein YcfA (HicA-like mRNA interferase family)
MRFVRGHLHVTIPNHGALAPKTLKSILRQAQITLADFMAALR